MSKPAGMPSPNRGAQPALFQYDSSSSVHPPAPLLSSTSPTLTAPAVVGGGSLTTGPERSLSETATVPEWAAVLPFNAAAEALTSAGIASCICSAFSAAVALGSNE